LARQRILGARDRGGVRPGDANGAQTPESIRTDTGERLVATFLHGAAPPDSPGE
jgi:hypothetical protein